MNQSFHFLNHGKLFGFKVGAGELAGWVLTAQKEWEKARGPLLKATTVSLGKWETAAPAEQGQGKEDSWEEP